MMFYNFCGILIFSLLFVQIFFVFVHCPFTSMFTLSHDIDLVNAELNLFPERVINIEDYKLKGDGVEESHEEGELSPATNTELLIGNPTPVGKGKGLIFDSEI